MQPYSEQKIVGRETELNALRAHLEKVAKQQGIALFIAGEAGVGKTRLVSELKVIATSKGFKVLSGNCLHESVTPYLPFIEALRSGGLEQLFAEEAPRVEAAYLVTKTGLLIKSILREKTDLDSDVFASMLITVGDFVRDSLSMLSGKKKEGGLNILGYGEYRILVEKGKNTYLAVIMRGRENEFLIDDMRGLLLKVNKKYGDTLRSWDGNDRSVLGIEKLLEPLIESGKYDGIYYGKDDPKARRNLLFESIALGITRQAEDNPILVCLEDLQWADPSSIGLMHYIVRNTKNCGLFIVGTYRPEDVMTKTGTVHPLVETMQLMAREELFERLELNRLIMNKMGDFVSSLLGRHEFDDKLLRRIYDETEGNPLFMVELLKMMAAEGVIKYQDDTWRLTRSHDEVYIPSKVHDVITRRLGRLEKDERRVMDIASVMGELFATDVLSSVLHVEKVQFLEQIRVIERIHRLVHSYNGVYKFDHARIRDVLYNEIPNELRSEYHAIIAKTIEEKYKGRIEDVLNILAFHFYRCRDQEKALKYLRMAADKARSEYSNMEAINLYRRVLDFEMDVGRQVEVLASLGTLYDLVGDYRGSFQTYEQALSIADEKQRKAEILAKIADLHIKKGEYDEAVKICNQSLSLVEGEGCKEEALALNSLGNVFLNRGELDKSLKKHERSVMISEKLTDEEMLSTALNNMGNSYFLKGELDRSVEVYKRCLEIGERIGDQRGSAHYLGNIGAIHHQRGEYDAAVQYFKKAMVIFERIGDQLGIAYILNNIGVMDEERSNYDGALENYHRSLEILERIGDQQATVASLHNIGKIHHYKREYTKAIAQFEKSLKLSEKIGNQMGMAFNFCGIAESYYGSHNHEKALEYSKKGYKLSKDAGFKEYQAVSCRIDGMVQRERAYWKESEGSFTECVTIFEEMGMDKEAGKSHYEFGLMWKAKGELPKAKEHLVKAVELFGKIGLEKESMIAKDVVDSLD